MVVPWRAQDCVHCPLRRRVRRPQLKRDPLGGALPPRKHSSVNSFGMVIARGAERQDARANLSSPRPTTLSPPRVGRAAPVLQDRVAQKQLPKARRPGLRWGARRARASVACAPSNTRLKLAAPGSWGNLSFVTNQTRRRSLSAGR